MTRWEIIDARRTLGMSRRELAEAILCSHSSVQRWESGRQAISPWFAGEILALLRRHERAAHSLAGSPFLPIPAWRLREVQGACEPAPAPDTYVPDPWRAGLATELPYSKRW